MKVLKVTFVTPVKFVPERTIMSPTYPASGDADEMVGVQFDVHEISPRVIGMLEEIVTPVEKFETGDCTRTKSVN